MRSRKSNLKRRSVTKPPPVLDGCRVVEYAQIKSPITYSGRSGVFRGDKEVGPVGALVIGEPLRDPDFVILHCNRRWRVLAYQGGLKSIKNAEARAERMYPGVSRAWMPRNISKAQARKYERDIWSDLVCSFCGRIPPEFEKLMQMKTANICNICVREFYREFEERQTNE